VYSIRLHGRGGQGAVVASKILADAYFRQGFFVQAFPVFGVERRGMAVAAFVRVDQLPILERGEVRNPNAVIVLDPTLLGMIEIVRGLHPQGTVLVNHCLAPEAIPLRGQFNLATVDASKIALKHRLGSPLAPIVNAVILGAFARLEKNLELKNILSAIRDGVPDKPEANVAAAQEAFDKVNYRWESVKE